MADNAAAVSTPEQQAALRDLDNGWTRQRVLDGIAVIGSIEGAAKIAGIHPATVYRYAASDSDFKEQIAVARARAGERVVGKAYRAVMGATREQLVKTPTLAIAVVNWLRPDLRPTAKIEFNDNRSVNAVVLQPEQLEAMTAAYIQAVRQQIAAPGQTAGQQLDDNEQP